MAQWLRTNAALEDLPEFSSWHPRQVAHTTCNSSSRGSGALVWPLWARKILFLNVAEGNRSISDRRPLANTGMHGS